MYQISKCTRIPTIIKTAQNIIRTFPTFTEKGIAEENIFMLKQQHEELLRLRKRILEDEEYLKTKINQTEEFIKHMEKVRRVAAFRKAVKEGIKKKE